MLVLARQRDQTVIIGDNIEITVVDIRGDKVRLGINAPKNITVHRKEIYMAIKRENEAAAAAAAGGQVPGPQGMPSHMRIVSGAERGSASPEVSSSGVSPSGVSSPQVSPSEVSSSGVALGGTDPFLLAAIEEARLGLKEGGLPIGSVLVRNGEIVARGHNRRVQNGDPMAHAEIDCLTRAGRQKTYKDTVLYSTLMPCYLCSGAVVQFGIPKVIAGESVTFKGGPEFLRGHGVEVVDVADPTCIKLMTDFIRDHPALWNEDIGI